MRTSPALWRLPLLPLALSLTVAPRLLAQSRDSILENLSAGEWALAGLLIFIINSAVIYRLSKNASRKDEDRKP